MITVHHLNNSRSQRVLWLLEELELEYEIVRYERDPKTLLAPESLRAIHPLGKSPVVVDGGRVLAESGAILEDLVDGHGSGRLAPPPNTPERLRYRYWMHYAEGSLMPLLLLKLVFLQIPKGPMPFFARPVARAIANGVESRFLGPQLSLHLRYVEDELGRFPWFAGSEFSAADIVMSFAVEAGSARGGGDFPRMKAFLERIHGRPAYVRALERGGPFQVAR